MLTKGGRSKTKNDDDDQVTSTTEPPKPKHDFQEGDDVFFHTEEGQHILGTVGHITNAHCQILFGDGTEQWARFDRLKKLSCSFEEEGPSPTPSDNNSSSSSSSNKFPSREPQQKTDVVCVECKHVKKVSSRKARLFTTTSSPYKCSRCSNNQPNHKTNIGGSSNSNLNSNSHQTPTFQKKPSIPRQLLKHLSTSESPAPHQQQTTLNCIGDIPNRQIHSLVHNNSLTSPSSSSTSTSTSQYLPTSSSLSSSSTSSLQSPTRPNNNMMNYRGSPTHAQHHHLQYQQHNSIGSTSTNNSSGSSSTNILNQQSGSMTIKPIRSVQISNPLKTGTNTTTNTTTPVPRTNMCFHCGNRTCVYDRVHCNMCERYCHVSCLPSVTPPALEGDKFWDVMCSKCGTQSDSEKGGSKVFSCRRNIQNWTDVVNLIINCLKVKSLGQQYFDLDVEIMPFFDNNIDRLHLPRQYKSASREDRKVNLLAALKNSRFREIHAKQAGSLWALKSDALSPSSPLSSSSSSSTSPMNTKTQKSKINNMTTAAASTTTMSTNKNAVSNNSNSNDKRDLYPNHQLRSPTTTATIIPNHNSNSNGSSNAVKKPTISYAQNSNNTNSSSPSFKPTNLTIPNRPNNLTLIPQNNNNNNVVNSSLSPSALNLSVKFKNNNTTITTTTNPTVHSPSYNASKSCDMSLQHSNNNNNSTNNNNFSYTNTGNNSVTVTSFPRVVSKEALLRNPPLMTTNIILSPTKTSLSNSSIGISGGGFQNKNVGYSNLSSHASSSSDCDKSKKLIQGQKNDSSSTTIGVDSRNSPRKSIKLNQSQKDDSDKPKPKSSSSSSLVHKISSHQTSDVNALQRLRIRTPTKQDSSSSSTATTTTTATNSPKSNIETVSKDSQMKKKDIIMPSFPSSSKNSITNRPQSCIPILSPKSDDRKRPHPMESNDIHELKMSKDSTVISLVHNTTNVQTSNTIVVRATKIARMDDTSPPTSTTTTTDSKNVSKESRLIRPKLTRSSSLNIKNGKITNNNNKNKNNNHFNKDGKQISNIGRLMRNRGKTGKGQISNSERKDDADNSNLTLKVFNPPNGLTDSSPMSINGYNSKLSRNANVNNNNSSGKLKKSSLIPIQNDASGGDGDQEDEENIVLNDFSSNLLNAAMFTGIRIQSLPSGPETRAEIEEEVRKVGAYLLAEEFTKKEELDNDNEMNMNDKNPNGDGNYSTSNSDNNNVKRLFSIGWPSLNNYPNTTATNNNCNNNDRDISRNNENHLVQNKFTMKTKNTKTSKRNLDDVDSYDILSVKVSEDGIIRYEVIWYEENSSDYDEADIFPEYEDMEIVVEEEDEDDEKEKDQQQRQTEKQEKKIEGHRVKEVAIKETTTATIANTPASSASSLKNGENSIKQMDIDKEKSENNKHLNPIQTSTTKSKDSSSGKINIKSEEEVEARKLSSKSSSNDSIRPISNSLSSASTSVREFPTNVTINYNRKQFSTETRNTVSIDEDDQVLILNTPPKKSKAATSILPVSTNHFDIIDLTDSP